MPKFYLTADWHKSMFLLYSNIFFLTNRKNFAKMKLENKNKKQNPCLSQRQLTADGCFFAGIFNKHEVKKNEKQKSNPT